MGPRLLRPVLILAALASCGGPTHPDPLAPERDRLARHEALWRSQRITSYQFRYRQACYCLPETTAPVVITVRDGSIAEVVKVGSGEPADASAPFYRSVEQIFDVIRTAIDDGAESLTVGYDEQLGYPRSVSVDPRRQVADDELQLYASELLRLDR